MIRLAELFFESGSFGLHFGLEMVPGVSRKELLELSSLAKSYHKTVLIHLRKDGIEVIDALKEALEIARTSGASIHILHLMYMAGTLDLMGQCLSLLSDAISGGLNITADTGLYEAFPTYIGSSILDPGWEKHYGQMITYRDVLISSGFYNGNFCSPSSFHFCGKNFLIRWLPSSPLMRRLPKSLSPGPGFMFRPTPVTARSMRASGIPKQPEHFPS